MSHTRDGQLRIMQRPWCCPEPRCVPINQSRDSTSKVLDIPQPGQSWQCWGYLSADVTFEYDGVKHRNDLKSCAYSALKGVISWQENIDDWRAAAEGYNLAALRLRALRGDEEPC